MCVLCVFVLVCCEWQVLDPSVAAWLMDPDSPPSSFTDIIKPFTDLKQVWCFKI